MKLSHSISLLTRTCCIAGVILLVFAVGGFAQARKQTGKTGNQLRQGQDPPPENKQGAPNRPNAQNQPNIKDPKLNRLIFDNLDLTQDQKQQIRMINRDSAPAIQRVNQEIFRRRKALEETIYADVFDENVFNQRMSDVVQAQAELLKLNLRKEAAFRQVLTPEQVRQFRKMREFAQQVQGANQPPDGGGGVP